MHEMVKISLSIDRAVLMICCLLLVVKDSYASCNEPNDEFSVIHQELGFLRNENKNQNIQIAQLKDEMEESKYNTISNHEMIEELIDQRIKEYLTGDTESDEPQVAVDRRGKRPARLLPLQLLFDRDDDDTTRKPPPRRFYGPPSNCSELSQLGYTLNGFYMVKPKSSDTTSNGDKIKKLETVFCSFKQEGPVNASRVEKRVGFLEMESIPLRDGVYFYAIWNKTYVIDWLNQAVLKFNYHLLNKGEAFRTEVAADPEYNEDALDSSPVLLIFQAPEPGVYQFVFTAIMKEPKNTSIGPRNTSNNGSMVAHLHHNFVSVAQSVSSNSGKVLMEATLNASHSDVFQVIIKNKSDTDEIKWASFSGHLLKEQWVTFQ